MSLTPPTPERSHTRTLVVRASGSAGQVSWPIIVAATLFGWFVVELAL